MADQTESRIISIAEEAARLAIETLYEAYKSYCYDNETIARELIDLIDNGTIGEIKLTKEA